MSSRDGSKVILLAGTVAVTLPLMLMMSVATLRPFRRKKETEVRNEECVYLDHNGTTPIRASAVSAMLPYLTTHFGNPSSDHAYGRAPREAVIKARASIASLVGGDPDGVVFTGCGTEADNLAIHLAIRAYQRRSSPSSSSKEIPLVVTTNVEHPAISECLKTMEIRGEVEVEWLQVDEECLITAEQVERTLEKHSSRTCLVTMILAQNEIGSVMPVADVCRICKKHGVLFHTDAAQAVGKIDLAALFAEEKTTTTPDMVTIVGHKFGAPKGVAALYVRPSLFPSGTRSPCDDHDGALLIGGGQESGRRAGTENVPHIVAMGAAAAEVAESLVADVRRMAELRDRLERTLAARLSLRRPNATRTNGPPSSDAKKRLPNTLSIGIRDVRSAALLRAVRDRVAASAGSACHSSGTGVSAVLVAMKVPREYAVGTLRLSVGVDTTVAEVEEAVEIIVAEVERQWSGIEENK